MARSEWPLPTVGDIMNTVIGLTYEEDLHADEVQKDVESKGGTFFRLNTDKIIGNYNITFYNDQFIIEDNEDTVYVDEDTTVWNRRTLDPDIPDSIDEKVRPIIETETERALNGLIESHKGKTVDKKSNIKHANNKITQARIARQYAGVEVPDTLITNNPNRVIEFYKNRDEICHKQQQVEIIHEGPANTKMAYTNKVAEEDLEHADLIDRNPCMFQDYIDKDLDVRFTTIEDKVIPVGIYSQESDLSKTDFRKYDFENVPYEVLDVPDAVEQFCRDMTSHFDLTFSQIDMVKKDDSYYFLEMNPNGQWLWLQDQTGYKISEDLAEELTNEA
mgnify:CR=1 FL=1